MNVKMVRNMLLSLALALPGIAAAADNTAEGPAAAEQAGQIDIYAGYYAREENDGKMAQISGYSHYVKFYPDNRFVRLYINYPYSTKVKADDVRVAFAAAIKRTSGTAFIRDKFGVFDERVIAHIDEYRRIEGQIMFDCSLSAPCRIVFGEGRMKTIEPAVVGERVTMYDLVSDSGN